MHGERCGSCRFFEDACNFWNGNEDERLLSDETSMFGFCRRHAPHPRRGLEIAETQWPIVHISSDWCGDWQAESADRKEATDGR
jgi:hypothetical protein